MKRAVLLALALCCGDASSEANLGGTLHRATLRDWHQSSGANQLATVSDIVERFLNIYDPVALAPKALAVHSCINKISANFKLRSQTVTDTAIACMAKLGYLSR